MGLKIGKYWAICAILVLVIGSLIMLAPVSADTDPANDTLGGAEATTDFSNFVGTIDSTGTDAFDFYSVALTGGASADWVQLPFVVSGMTPAPCQARVLMPADNGYMFLVVNKTFGFDGNFNLSFNASVTGTYIIELSGGLYSYDGSSGSITSGTNANYNGYDDFAGAMALTNGASGAGAMIDGENYIDIFTFTTSVGDTVDINFTGANIGGWNPMLLDSSYADASSMRTVEGTGYYNITFVETTASTYYFVMNAPAQFLTSEGPYAYTAKIMPPAANEIPTMSNAVINPASIYDTMAANVSLSVDAVDSDGTVTNVNVTCSLWPGVVELTKGSGDTWSGYVNIPAGKTVGAPQDVHFLAKDDDGEWNDTVMGNITVVAGNQPVVSDYDLDTAYAVKVDEDSGNYLLNLTSLVTDEDAVNLTYEMIDETSQFIHENFTVKIENNTWINVTLTENAFNDPVPFTINVTDDMFYVTFNITFEISAVNDAPMWDELQKIKPSGTAVDIVDGENITLELDEDTEYNFTLVAMDVDGDAVEYSTNLTNARLNVEKETGNVSFNPAQEDVGDLTVWFTATDGTDDLVTIVNFTIANVNDAPDEPGLTYEITDADEKTTEKENLTVVFTVTAPVDVDGDVDFTYTFDFGDDGTGVTEGPTNETTFEISYTYAAAGTYNVTMTVEDAGGLTNETSVTEIDVLEPPSGPEWWTLGFKKADKTDGAADDVTVAWTTLKMDVSVEDLGDGNSKATTVYEFAGTCSDNVVVVHIYFGSQLNDDEFTYYTYYNPEDFTLLEIEASGGSWSWTYTAEVTYPTPDPVSDDDDVEPSDDVYHMWYAAVGWTEDTTYNIAEKELTFGSPPGDDDDDDDSGMLFVIVAVVAVAAILLIVIVIVVIIVLMKKKKAPEEEMPPPEGAPAEGGPMGPEGAPAAPMYCACGAEIPAGSPTCPMCGQPAPAPPAEAPVDQQVQYDEYGQPIQAAPDQPAPPAEGGYEQPGMEQPAPPAEGGYEQPGMEQPAPPVEGGYEQPAMDPGAAPPMDPAAAPPAPEQPGMPPQ